MPNNELQELLNARFDGYSHSTNESVWSAIELQLDAKKSDRSGFWFWIINGIAATLLVGLVFQSSFKVTSVSNLSQVQVEKSTTKQEIKEEQNPNRSEVSKNKNPTLSELSEGKPSLIESSNSQQFAEESKTVIAVQREVPVLKNTSKGIKFVPFSSNLSKASTQIAPKKEDIANLSTRALESIGQTEITNFRTPTTISNKSDYFRQLPIHLGFEVTYLRRSRAGTDWLAVIDTGYQFVNNQLGNNRHFEFNLFTQFDFTKRFSTSIGIGYSSSKFDVKTSQPSTLSGAYSGSVTSDQRILTVPIQSKFVFFQQNRFSLSAGLTFQGEFEQNVYLEIVKTAQPPAIVTSTPVALTAESIIVTKQSIQQFAIEPFVQLSIGISPRLSTFANLGYRRYFNQSELKNISPNKLNFMNADFGINFRIN